MVALFGFMDYLIIVKWTTNWAEVTDGSMQAPSVIAGLIDMMLGFGNSKQEYDFIENQQTQMQILVILAVLCIPFMLLSRPLLEKDHHSAEVHEEHDNRPLL